MSSGSSAALEAGEVSGVKREPENLSDTVQRSFPSHQERADGLLFFPAEGNLDLLACNAIRLPWGVKREFQKLRDAVSTIKAVFLLAEELEAVGPAVIDWSRKLNDIIYEADHLVDDVSYEAKKSKKVRILFPKLSQLVRGLVMGHKIKMLRERLNPITAYRKFALGTHLEKRVGDTGRASTHSIVCVEEVFGREDDKKAVIKRLMSSDVEMKDSILPIVGIGGIGKTVLAQLVFNDKMIRSHFELALWVCVSVHFDVKRIVEKILESATGYKKKKDVGIDVLAKKLQDLISGRTFILVLDDMWDEDGQKWMDLKVLLMTGARGSRILVTTRSLKVAQIVSTLQPYSLGGLDGYASWCLFKQATFRNGQGPENSQMWDIGREVLKKCVGVPLAVTVLGRMLYSKNSEREWLSFKDTKLSRLPQCGIDILPTLYLSYKQLPLQLKHCFAYCSLFPVDYEIDKSTLIKQWIAQGFIKSCEENQCLEDVGNEYFIELLWRSFFLEVDKDKFGNVRRCKIHRLMHDLAISVASSLVTTLDHEERKIDEKTRHVAIDDNIDFSCIVSTSLYGASRIRTFLCPNVFSFEGGFDCEAIFSSCKLLHTLDLHGRNLNSVPNSIGKLKHLRYLDLSKNNHIKKLPYSITTLQNLQTLRLSYCYSLEELPRDIKNLINLKHLEIDYCWALTYMPRGLGQLTNLQTLSRFVVDSSSIFSHSCGLNELEGLNNLRGELLIWGLSHRKNITSEYGTSNLKEKRYLCALDLNWRTGEDVEDFDDDEIGMSLEGLQPHQNLEMLCLSYYQGSGLPHWLLSLTKLVRLELNNCEKCKCLPLLSKLPSLEHLRLNNMDAMQYISGYVDRNEFSSSSMAPASFFPSLKQLYLFNCPDLKGWWMPDSSVEVDNGSDKSPEITMSESPTRHHSLPSFPCLSELLIQDCPMLTSMPIFPNLEKELFLSNASLKPLQTTVAASSCLYLEHLILSSIMELENLPEWLQKLCSLCSLTIEDCHKLKFLSPGLKYLTRLKELKIRGCPELQLYKDEDELPQSLEVLELVGCFGLTALPEGIGKLGYLRRLRIEESPILSRRCEKETGEDWPKIAHIPEIYLDPSQQREDSNAHSFYTDSDAEAEAVESVERERKGIIRRLFKSAGRSSQTLFR